MIHFTVYEKDKDAQWVTFVHGAGGSSSIWFKQIRDFQKHFNVLLLDLRGHGNSNHQIKKAFKQKIISLYSLIEASGGVVRNEENKMLWIYRLGKWDLPKGKLEKNESFKVAAIREVEEECNVQAKLEFKLCTTYHTYTHKNQRVLKRTKWYMMHTNQRHKLIPQKEENIEKVEWFNPSEMNKTALSSTYSSIRYVIQRFSMLQIPFKS